MYFSRGFTGFKYSLRNNMMKNSFAGSNSMIENKLVAKNFAASVIYTVREPVLILDKDSEFVDANAGFYSVFEIEGEELLVSEMNNNKGIFREFKEILKRKLTAGEGIKDYKFVCDFPKAQVKSFLVNANYTNDAKDNGALILISFKELDTVEPKGTEEKNNLVNLHEIFSQAPAMICLLRGPEHVFDFANENYFQLVGHRNIIGKNVREALPEIEDQGFFEMLDGVYQSGEVFKGKELPVKLDVGEKELKNSYLDFVYQPILNASEEVSGIFVHAVDITEKVAARRKIEESENELRYLIDTVPAIIWITKLDGQNYYLNKNWYKYTGQTVSEGRDFGWLNAVHPDDRQRVDNIFTKAVKNREGCHMTFRLRNKDGSYRWVLDSGRPMLSAEGEYEGMIGTVIDVHEEKIKEQLVREKEHRIRSIIEEATVATALYTGKEMKIEIANDAMVELWGKDHSVIGTMLHEALPELEGQPFHELLQGVYNTGETYWGKEDPVDLVIDGKLQTGYFNFTYKALRDENGDIYGILNMAVDVSETVRSKELLKESESRFRQMADLMPEKVANTDAEGNFIYFNQGWLEYTGLKSEQLAAKGWANFIHPDEKEAFQKNWQNSLDTGSDFEMEFRYKNKHRQYNWHLSRAEAITDENGKIQMWICTATEIQRLKAEEKRKEDFLKMVSHELKTPITSIKGYVQFLLSLLNNEEEVQLSAIPFKTSLERMDHQIVRLTRLISEMLDLTRIEKNKLELQKQTFCLNTLVAETVQDIEYTNTQHKIVITAKEECWIHADKDRIGQVLINLVTNSIKYSPFNWEIEVKIEKSSVDKVLVSVKDFGIGIDKQNQQKIFKRFYRIDEKSEETYSGFGIGLYLAREIIERHNGIIEVKSEIGRGSVFTFTLDAASEEL
ncbi:PAS domain S-box protein [Autumnicola musiva]|uniref:histidine kinase n=1 Tax=Autumnicola musiva TaxID=3075589 RepID=A0ABU3D9P3_9FLAO|nr:PAS domain S-box protein [Zunongwangia sp. F117]MDT0677703.1 PAS domain S-box protein [Zunongwangia sp. F117]